MTINDLADIWLNVQAGRIRPISLRGYESTLKNHILPTAFSGTEITDFTADVAGKSFAELRERKTKSQLFEIKKTLGSMFSYCVDEGLLSKNPMQKIYVDKTPPETVIPTQEEIKKFLAGTKASSPYYIHFLVFATTGMRVAELRGLQIADVKANKITIRRVFYDGKIHETKTKASRRTLAVPDFVAESLWRHIETIKGCIWLFPNKQGRPVSHQYLAKELHFWQNKLNLPQTKLHAFRHAHATFLLENGHSLKAIQQRMGWASPQMLLERYAHVTTEEKEKIISKIEAEFKTA